MAEATTDGDIGNEGHEGLAVWLILESCVDGHLGLTTRSLIMSAPDCRNPGRRCRRVEFNLAYEL